MVIKKGHDSVCYNFMRATLKDNFKNGEKQWRFDLRTLSETAVLDVYHFKRDDEHPQPFNIGISRLPLGSIHQRSYLVCWQPEVSPRVT